MSTMQYNPREIEEKWQKHWADNRLYEVDMAKAADKFYCLVMFPYPSGDKLHVGHWYNYAPVDSYARYMKMQGRNVFEPFGFDSFGLPAENYAIKTGTPPMASTEKNVEYMRQQIRAIGTMYDWSKEVVTSHADYYKWTQWVFLELYKKGLAYKKKAPVNWCPTCQTVLANEQVKDGECDRCASQVVHKDLAQWFFKITDYAEQLLENKQLDWPEKTRLMQQNWIGKSTGVNIDFKMSDSEEVLTCYTTRPDTIYSVTFLVIAPEHPWVEQAVSGSEFENEVNTVIKKIKKQTDIERTSEGGKDKLGAFTGKFVLNPVNGEKIPVYIANFALMYGTGVVMADAHDQRDFEFARKYDIPLKFVISLDGMSWDPKNSKEAYVEDGILFDSGEFSGMNNREALPKIANWMEEKGFGKKTVNYRLRDWLISRQRYWGAPVPIINCKKCGEVAVPEKNLPVLLPEEGVDYLPKGKAPLASVADFINVSCPKCGGEAEREPDTMDTFVDSSWYYLRYLSPKKEDGAFDKELIKKWMPVDLYVGGPEHACMHLLYARFIHKVLVDDPKSEPFKRLVHQGLITKDGAKMSKSKGNVVSPDEFITKYGSDVFRMYLMFMGPFTDGGDWNDRGITGISRFVDKAWNFISSDHLDVDSDEAVRAIHGAVKKVGEDIERFQFNTAISTLMSFLNLVKGSTRETKKVFVQLIAPLAPHFAEECWSLLACEGSVFDAGWPTYDEKYLVTDSFELVIQINGKVRAKMQASANLDKAGAIEIAKNNEIIKQYVEGKKIVKEIYVPGKLLNLVVV